LIKQGDISVTTGTTVYPGKLVIYNNDEYRWDGNQWLRLGSITNSGSWNLLTTSYDKTIAFTKIAFCKPWRSISYNMFLSDEPNDSNTGNNSKAWKNRIWLGNSNLPNIQQQALGSGESSYANPAASLYGTTTIDGNSFYVWDKYTVPRYYAGAESGAVFDNNMMYVYVNKPVYPFEYPEKDTPPALISFNSVEERDAYTEVYNGLLCQVGDDYFEYNNGWKSHPYLTVDNVKYLSGKWVMSDTNSGSKINTLTVTVESPVECIVYAECIYGGYLGTASIFVDGTDAVSWNVTSSALSGSCTLTPGTHRVTFNGAKHYEGTNTYYSYLNPSKCYIQFNT
jgi:hypothetical protein